MTKCSLVEIVFQTVEKFCGCCGRVVDNPQQFDIKIIMTLYQKLPEFPFTSNSNNFNISFTTNPHGRVYPRASDIRLSSVKILSTVDDVSAQKKNFPQLPRIIKYKIHIKNTEIEAIKFSYINSSN